MKLVKAQLIEDAYEAIDELVTFVSGLDAEQQVAAQDLLDQAIAVRTDLMDELGLLEEEPLQKTKE